MPILPCFWLGCIVVRLQKLKMQLQKSEYRIQKPE